MLRQDNATKLLVWMFATDGFSLKLMYIYFFCKWESCEKSDCLPLYNRLAHLQLICQNQDDSFFMYWSHQYHLKAPKGRVIMFYSIDSCLRSDPSNYEAF